MNRHEQFLKIVTPLAASESAAIKYQEHLEELFDVIIPEKIGSEFCHAIENNDYEAAIKACADYYRAKPDFSVPNLSGKGAYNEKVAEDCMNARACEVSVPCTFPGGVVDFLYNPTDNCETAVNHEWVWQFNRHNQWTAIARAYNATGNEEYAKMFEMQLLKWIDQTEAGEKWNRPYSAWRTIECGIRLLGSWPSTYDGFRKSPSLCDTALLLMIASMHRQSIHLINHRTSKNWLMMEANGIYTFAALFTELSDSEENRKTATNYLITEVESQILPDGMHNELSPDYHGVVLSCAANFYTLAVDLGLADEIPEKFVKLMKNTVHAAILLSSPGFTQPKTNDTYTINTDSFTWRAEKMFGPQPEYRFVNTKRAEGTPPSGETASNLLPYAGFAVMRSDWSADASYMCFDVGPLGMAHIHQDKLNINIFKGSEELIYDDGGGQYDLSEERVYALTAAAHNTVLVDGMGQNRHEPYVYETPVDVSWVSNDIFDYAVSSYIDGFGENRAKLATHKREVRFTKPDIFCVTDTLTSSDGNAHDYDLLFHLDTLKVNELPEYENGLVSDYGKTYDIVMIPVDDAFVKPKLTLASGTPGPDFHGWYNGRNDKDLHKATEVSRKVTGVKDYKFTTLLIPIKAGSPTPKVTHLTDTKLLITKDGKDYEIDINNLNK